jgi:LysM repeat protein
MQEIGMVRRWILYAIFLLSLKALQAADFTTVSLPLLAMVRGQSAVAEVQIDCITDGCSAFDITIQFEPQVIQVDEVELGPFLGDQVFTAENRIDNETGMVQFAATALGDLPQTQESVLLRLTLTALDSGTSSFRIVELTVGDMIGNPLETVGVDGGVVVNASAIETDRLQVEQQATVEAEATAEIVPSQQVTCQYTIRSGDTLSGIAIANRVTVAQISEMNNITDPRRIVVGQTLTIAASDCRSGVESGQNLEVYDCVHLGNNVFEWYSVRIDYDARGNPIRVTNRQGPFQGAWRPGCPAGQAPSSGGSRRDRGSSSPNS